ncbi:hypothetical protein CPB86DRAFT_192777 [Serendipita vermifera]|nr:hypothetical protein CPB86DRAFT_192777 [Serendipita vermifera]
MKRLFVRRDKDRNTPLSSGPPSSSALTPAPIIVTQSDEYAPDAPFRRSNDLAGPTLAPPAAQRKSSFFVSVRSMSRGTLPSSQSGSEAGSAPLTTSSRSASSDTSSQMGATPEEGLVVHPPPLSPLHASKPLTSPSSEQPKPSWSSWVTSIGKKNTVKSKLTTSPTTSVFQAARSTVQTALIGPSRAKRKDHAAAGEDDEDDEEDEGEEGSETSDESDDSGESSSWDGKNDDDTTITSANASSKSGGRKAKRTPGPGRRRRTPHSQKNNAQARPVFGNPRAAAVPLSKESSKALANLHALTIDALVPPTSAPPLVQSSSSVPFPRSSNRVHLSSNPTHLHHHASVTCTANAQHSALHTEILRKRLLRRIERRNLSPSEQTSIQPLSTRSAKPKLAEKRRRPATEETYEDSKAVGGGWSKGMKRWAMRAPYEERVVVWSPRDGKIAATAVKRDPRLRVPPLEFSEGAEALAGLHRQNELPPPPSDIYVPASNRKLPPPLVIPRSSHGISKPMATSQNANSTGRMPPSRLRPTTLDDALLAAQDEDDLPLGVVMLQRRQKEEADERRRRLVQAEKAERERRAREEEEKRRRYAEEVLAARARREQDRTGKPGTSKNAWLEGELDALPPPPRPYASNHPRSSSNPDLSLHVPRPDQQRRQTTESYAGSVTSSTATTPTVGPKRQETLRQHSAPTVPSPWTGFPNGGGMSGGSEYDAASVYSGSLRVPKTAPILPMNYGMIMMPPVPDPVSMAMFEQGLLRPWAMPSMGGGSSSGNLTPPRAPFGFASSGDSSGSLTPPRFPTSRPSSWSSNEDVRLTMQRSSSGVATGSNSLGVRPDSGAYSSGGSAENQDWRKSRSSMLVGGVNMDQNRSSSSSRSPVDSTRPGLAAGNVSSSHTLKNLRSDGNLNAHSDARHRSNQASTSTNRTTPQQPPSSFSMQNRSRSDVQSRTRTTPAPSAPKNPYGLGPPTDQGYSSTPNSLSAKSGSTLRGSMLSMSRSTDEVHRTGSSSNGRSVGSQQNPPKHAHSKSGGQPIQRKTRLFG